MHCTRQKPNLKQGNLFDRWTTAPPSPPPPRSPPPVPPTGKADTSRAAAATVRPKFGKRQRQALAMILGRGVHGATNEEISVACGWLLQSTCPVTYSLAKAGLIADSGQRRTTSTGSAAKVWTASEGKD